jgi:hypothetical protein
MILSHETLFSRKINAISMKHKAMRVEMQVTVVCLLVQCDNDQVIEKLLYILTLPKAF